MKNLRMWKFILSFINIDEDVCGSCNSQIKRKRSRRATKTPVEDYESHCQDDLISLMVITQLTCVSRIEDC